MACLLSSGFLLEFWFVVVCCVFWVCLRLGFVVIVASGCCGGLPGGFGFYLLNFGITGF